ncbi:hypothetical protein EUGRSUZ_F02144 [Eucalyptus grandis]|uniref:Uncharacterized protein n=2 Tax=Eucalyptus grandis TaxID=71139 RepID=A0ACC3KHY2_EUCGR|nr:hypothetical protein EUGRSUZ_F02144 [Eucalyptus grandis]
MREEDLEGLGVEELGQLENKLGAGLSLVLKTEVSSLTYIHLVFIRTKKRVPHAHCSRFTLWIFHILVVPLFPGRASVN